MTYNVFGGTLNPILYSTMVRCRTGKVRRSETNVLPLCYAANKSRFGPVVVKRWSTDKPTKRRNNITVTLVTRTLLVHRKTKNATRKTYLHKAFSISMQTGP